MTATTTEGAQPEAPIPAGEIAAVRAFNRFYTNVMGVLQEGLLDTPYSLTQARVIFELARSDTRSVADLKRSLNIDGGYLSRVLSGFESHKLIARARSRADARRRELRLTAKGRRLFEELDARAAAQTRALLAPLSPEDRRRLVGAMGAIERLLGRAPPPSSFVLRALGSGDLGWVIHRHGVLYQHEYGWDESFEALVAGIVADYARERDPRREGAWIAEVDGERAGSVFCVKKDAETAQLRLLLVEPRFRGAGIGGRLVEECVRFARRARYKRVMLWTNDVLVDARRIYEHAGFSLVEEEAHHSFGHDLVGQNWLLVL